MEAEPARWPWLRALRGLFRPVGRAALAAAPARAAADPPPPPGCAHALGARSDPRTLAPALALAQRQCHGVLALALAPEDRVAAAALLARAAALAPGMTRAVALRAPPRAPPGAEAAAARDLLLALGAALTQALSLSWGDDASALAGGADAPGGGAAGHARCLFVREAAAAEHVDRALFNLVLVDRPQDLEELELFMGGASISARAAASRSSSSARAGRCHSEWNSSPRRRRARRPGRRRARTRPARRPRRRR
jgi:hypothetical protein